MFECLCIIHPKTGRVAGFSPATENLGATLNGLSILDIRVSLRPICWVCTQKMRAPRVKAFFWVKPLAAMRHFAARAATAEVMSGSDCAQVLPVKSVPMEPIGSPLVLALARSICCAQIMPRSPSQNNS
jgi:hypothetical protein